VNFLRVILVTLVIFATGALSGYFVARKPAASSASPAPAKSVLDPTNAPSVWNKSREEMRASLQRELNASDEQMAKVDEIMSQSRKRSREIWQTMKGSMEVELDRVKEEIGGVLDEGQASKYEEIMKRRGTGGHKKEQNKTEPRSCQLNYLPGRQCFL
jgi:hypothetical protein